MQLFSLTTRTSELRWCAFNTLQSSASFDIGRKKRKLEYKQPKAFIQPNKEYIYSFYKPKKNWKRYLDNHFFNWDLISIFCQTNVFCVLYGTLSPRAGIYISSHLRPFTRNSIFCSWPVLPSSWTFLSVGIPEFLLANQYFLLVHFILCFFFTTSPSHLLGYSRNSIKIIAGLTDYCISVRPQNSIHLQQDIFHFASAQV